MARPFSTDYVLVREVEELTIIFLDSHRIYIYPSEGFGVLLQRYGEPKGDYRTRWRTLRRELLRYKHLTLTRCCELAERRGYYPISTTRRINLEKIGNIKIRKY